MDTTATRNRESRDLGGRARTGMDARRLLSALRSVDLVRFGAVAFQFGLLVLITHQFALGSKAFLYVIVLAWCGFVVNHFLPSRIRFPFFAGLSLTGVAIVFGVDDGLWLVGTGLGLIGLAHVPLPFRVRLLLIALAVIALGLLRTEVIGSPWPSAVWPILGSMMMFRLMIYLYDLRHRSAPFDLWRSLSYFFMLPNVCFPLFPVVDYKTFCRCHFDEDAFYIYQKGIRWMLRGIIHLLLYRAVYQNLLVDPAAVTSAGGAARAMVTTFLLYLRVSGDFHLIVGMLHLFGFNLPETFHLWMLSNSFTDFWRRINIYWKNFMQKLFFNPAHFRLRKVLGPQGALFGAAAVTFLATWILHSYQWFWIRGNFPLTWQDTVFWIFLGVMILGNMYYENRFGRRRSLTVITRTFASQLGLALRTIIMFVTVVVIWSLWTSTSFSEWQMLISHFGSITAGEAGWICLGLLALGGAAVFYDRFPSGLAVLFRAGEKKAPAFSWRRSVATATVCGFILVLGRFPLLLAFEPAIADVVGRLGDNRLNRRDARLLERGYYEDLTDVTRFNSELAELYSDRPANWNVNLAIRHTPGDYPPYDLHPSKQVPYKGAMLITNRWGMRDREYEKEKPSDTLRIALLGSSHSVGIGVENGETYENLVEDELNRSDVGGRYRRYEILNLAVSGYGPLCRLAMMEKKGFDFNPDVVLNVGIDDLTWIVKELSHAVDKNLDVPYKGLMAIVNRAGVEAGLPKIVAEQRLRPYRAELLEWVYRRFSEQCRQRGVAAVATFIPLPEDRRLDLEDMQKQMELAREAGFVLLDTSGAYARSEDLPSLWIAKWDRHPNAEGHRLLADSVYQALRTYLATQ